MAKSLFPDAAPAYLSALVFSVLVLSSAATAAEGSPETLTAAELEFFESKIRPVLIEHCYECHNSADSAEGGFIVDHRKAMLQGGDGGAVIVEGKPSQSKLIKILRHEIEGLEMPEGGPKLDEAVVKDFETWIRIGTPDPRKDPPSDEELQQATSWEETLQRRKGWWSFRPIARLEVPGDPEAVSNPIDRFINRSLSQQGLKASPPADTATLVRRLYFNMLGLPPSAEQADEWTRRIDESSERQTTIAELVDRLLDSPQFGERWARHWMDWIRYAESHGSEGDPRIDNAWHYRDYLIRAINADVPYDQLVREHLAGDLLESPRLNGELGINESIIGTAQLRMVFHGFAPTDALDEKVRFTDDQINVLSKAFLGLTVSCARCHDHKFDAISQADYYALFGVLGSCRPGRNVIDVPKKQTLHRERLTELKDEIRRSLSAAWLKNIDEISAGLMGLTEDQSKTSALAKAITRLKRQARKNQEFANPWEETRRIHNERHRASQSFFQTSTGQKWNLGDPKDRRQWYQYGVGLDQKSSPGQFAISIDGDRVIDGIFPSGVYSHGLTAKHPARLSSPDFEIGDDVALWAEVIGDKEASLRYVVQDYPRSGTVYPVTRLKRKWTWQRFDLTYWLGDSIHVELATAKDAPLLTANQPRSWFGVRRVIVTRKDAQAPDLNSESLLPLFASTGNAPPSNLDEFRQTLSTAVESAITAWEDGTIDDSQALFLGELLELNVLPNSIAASSELKQLLTEYRRLEEEIPVPTRVPGVEESRGTNQPLMIRGNHKLLGKPISRRFLEAIDDAAYETTSSGRLELAEDLLRADNPLTKRVIVNRIWHHLFGRGIVSTPDNFGRLGNTPSHPELLEWMATRFAEEDWSIKKLIRRIVTSQTWQRSSVPGSGASEKDPENIYLSHANVRRLEAEAIRDTLLQVSGRLNQSLYGPPVAGNSPRRSVYVRVIRNSLDPFLRAFDFPEPFSAVGRRDVTNVPAQSLAMMNDSQVEGFANAWAGRTLSEHKDSAPTKRIESMFRDAFARSPSSSETERALQFLEQTREVTKLRSEARRELTNQIDGLTEKVNSLIETARGKYAAGNPADEKTPTLDVPPPVAQWDFTKGLNDLIGSADIELKNGAKSNQGGLILRNGGYAVTAPLGMNLAEKTLEVWVKLDNLDQRGGGAMSVQTRNGVVFDAIVFAEQRPRHWLAGSNNFARTQPFEGTDETVATSEPVHIAITYDSGGQVTGYRNGQPYGRSYQSSGPQRFDGNDVVVSFGVRHLPAVGNRMLSGTILQARLYNEALSSQQVAVSASGSGTFVSEERLLEFLTENQRQELAQHREQILKLTTERNSIPESKLGDEMQAWSELARAMFSFQEFMYVR